MLNDDVTNCLRAFGVVIQSWSAIQQPDEDRWFRFVINAYSCRGAIQRGEVGDFLKGLNWSEMEAEVAEENFWRDVQLISTYLGASAERKL